MTRVEHWHSQFHPETSAELRRSTSNHGTGRSPMIWSQLVDRARKCGVSEPELMVFSVVRYHTPMQVRHMARWALKEHDSLRLLYSMDNLDVAVENCLPRGWMRVLSRKDVGRQPPDYSTFASYNKCSPGVMDFTAEGFALAIRIFGEGNVGHA